MQFPFLEILLNEFNLGVRFRLNNVEAKKISFEDNKIKLNEWNWGTIVSFRNFIVDKFYKLTEWNSKTWGCNVKLSGT